MIRDRLGVGRMLREAWQSRALLPRLGVRTIVKGTAGTKIGRGWLVLRPAISIFGMALLFGAVLSVTSDGLPYIIFLLVGTHAWMMFDRTAFWAVRSFDAFRRPARSLNFPLLLIPLTAVIAMSIEATVIGSFAALTVLWFLITDGHLYVVPDGWLVVAICGYVLALLVGLSLGIWLAVLNAKTRDVRIIFRTIVLRMWMFITPVLYPLTQLPAGWRWLGIVNPVTAPVLMVKRGLLGTGDIPLTALGATIGWIVVVGGTGLMFFASQGPGVLRSRMPAAEEDEEEEFI